MSTSARIRTYLRSNVLGLVAIFIALGGTAIALPGTNTVQSNDIGPGEQVKNGDTKPIRGTWVANDSLRGVDIDESSLGAVPLATTAAGVANNAIDSASVDNNSLTGADIDESSLGTVPNATSAASAASAANANLLDNLNSTQLSPASGDGRTADLTLTGSGQTVLSAPITTARSSLLLVAAAVDLVGSGGQASCTLRFDGGPGFSVVDSASGFASTTLPVVWAQPVGAGAHTVDLLCFTLSNATVDDAGMIVSAHL